MCAPPSPAREKSVRVQLAHVFEARRVLDHDERRERVVGEKGQDTPDSEYADSDHENLQNSLAVPGG